MSVTGGLVVYAMYWFLGLFWMLPLRIRSQEEEGNVVPGTPPGAPVSHGLKWKIVGATVVAAFLWAVTYLIVSLEVIDVRGDFG